MKIESVLYDDYKLRINKVFRHIEENLEADLSLNLLSEIALFSPFHFHRIFKTITQETPNNYVIRRRIERSASDLIRKDYHISDIALKNGFNDTSSFSRSFKKYYGLSPSEFRKQNPNKFSKIRQLESKNGQAYPNNEEYICIIDNLTKWINMNANIKVKECSTFHIAAISHIGINGLESTFGKLIRWANSKHLMQDPDSKMGRLFYDSIKITEADKVRMLIFLATDHVFETDGEVERQRVEGGKCVLGRFEIQAHEFEKAWTGMYIWMNENGYQTSSGHPYEIYHNDYRLHPEGKFIVDLFIPIK